MASTSISTESAQGQRVPAWKRLGLKLKQQTYSASSDGNQQQQQHRSTALKNSSSDLSNKRKPSGTHGADLLPKKARTDPRSPQITTTTTTTTTNRHIPAKPKEKSVSFGLGSSASGNKTTANKTNGHKKPAHPATTEKRNTPTSKTPAPAKPAASKKQITNLQPAVNYLRLWKTDRGSWKFMKNHQTRLFENVFATNGTTIPPTDIAVFYEYIKALKGQSRERLREAAKEAQRLDMEQGSSAFSDTSAKDITERRQKEYESTIETFLSPTLASPDKPRFEEINYVLQTTDMEMQRRVVKRMRAEIVVEELANSEDETTTGSMAASKTTETQDSETREKDDEEDEAGNSAETPEQTQRKKPRRLRKARTSGAIDEYDDTGTDENTSSSSSSSEDEEDDGKGDNKPDTSSSSSSSSSSESDDEPEDEEAGHCSNENADAMDLDQGAGAGELETSSSSSSSSSSEDEAGSGDNGASSDEEA